MRKLFPMLAVAVLASGLTLIARAADTKTIVGEGKCTKCALSETDSCSNAVEVEEDGKTVTYYVTQNAVSKSFHGKICKGPKKVKVTGTVKDADGKMEITPTKMVLAPAGGKDDDADAPKPKSKVKKVKPTDEEMEKDKN